jgi:DUF2924 family protein
VAQRVFSCRPVKLLCLIREPAVSLRRIAWRLQVRAEGHLSERARRRVLEIADDADLRLRAPEGFLAEGTSHKPDLLGIEPRLEETGLPVPGTVVTRPFENRRIVVTVLEQGFEYRYANLEGIYGRIYISRGHRLTPVYHGESGVRTLRELSRSYLRLQPAQQKLRQAVRVFANSTHRPPD